MAGKKKNKPEIVGWTGYDTAERRIKKGEYKLCDRFFEWNDVTEKEYKEIRDYLVEYLSLNSRIVTKRHGRYSFFNGHYHQEARNGIPVIKYKNSIYAFLVTKRRWGDIIAEVLSKIDGKKIYPWIKLKKNQ